MFDAEPTMLDRQSYRFKQHMLIAFILAPVAGMILGAFVGIITYIRYFDVSEFASTLVFIFGMCFPFGLISGFLWGLFFGWIAPVCGYKRSLLTVVIYVVASSFIPAIMEEPLFVWFFGSLGSLFGAFHLIIMKRQSIMEIERAAQN